jgi:tripartite-type tricarboxylate transporter receptor subunit TctC
MKIKADHMLFVSAQSPLGTVDDLLAADHFSFASGERGSLGYTSQQVVDEILDFDSNFIAGYDDQGERLAAIERGDADAVIGPVRTFESIGRLGDVRPLLRLAHDRSSQFPEVPTALELDGLDSESAELLETHFGMASLFFTVMGPPAMPEATVDDLREAFWDVANDQQFLTELQDRGLNVVPENEYLTGHEVDELIPDLLDVPERYQALLEELSQ